MAKENCTLKIKLDFKKDNGQFFSIDEKYMRDVNIEGTINSDDCDINIQF